MRYNSVSLTWAYLPRNILQPCSLYCPQHTMVAQENLCGYLAGLHLGGEADSTCVPGTLTMSVVSTPIPFPLLLTLTKDQVFGPYQIPTLVSYSNALLIDFHFFSCLENSYLLKGEEGRRKFFLLSFIPHKLKVGGPNFDFWYS